MLDYHIHTHIISYFIILIALAFFLYVSRQMVNYKLLDIVTPPERLGSNMVMLIVAHEAKGQSKIIGHFATRSLAPLTALVVRLRLPVAFDTRLLSNPRNVRWISICFNLWLRIHFLMPFVFLFYNGHDNQNVFLHLYKDF